MVFFVLNMQAQYMQHRRRIEYRFGIEVTEIRLIAQLLAEIECKLSHIHRVGFVDMLASDNRIDGLCPAVVVFYIVEHAVDQAFPQRAAGNVHGRYFQAFK